jgi:hypothetical protein
MSLDFPVHCRFHTNPFSSVTKIFVFRMWPNYLFARLLNCTECTAFMLFSSLYSTLSMYLTNYLRGLEFFFRNLQSLSYSRIFQNCMEPEGSLPCSQEPCRWIQSIPPHRISLRSIRIVSSHLRLGFPNGLCPGILTKTLFVFLFYTMRAICLAYLILLHIITLITFTKSTSW